MPRSRTAQVVGIRLVERTGNSFELSKRLGSFPRAGHACMDFAVAGRPSSMMAHARRAATHTSRASCRHRTRVAARARHGRLHGPGRCARDRSPAARDCHRVQHHAAGGRCGDLLLRPALRLVPAAVWAGWRPRRQDPGHGGMPGGLLARDVRLCVRAEHPGVRHLAVPDRCGRGGGHPDVARLHRRQLPLPGPPGRAGAVHERADDRADRRQHPGRPVRPVPGLALHLRGVRRRRARRIGAAGARGPAVRGTPERGAPARAGDPDGSARGIVDLRGPARRAAVRILDGR